jgi:hypothetical protein
MNNDDGTKRRKWIRVGMAMQAGILVAIISVAICVKAHGVPSARTVHQPPASSVPTTSVSAAPGTASVGPVANSATMAATAKAPEDAWSSGDIVASLSSFYQTIITVLIALLGLLGVVSVLTLRFLSNATAEDMAHKAAGAAMERALEAKKFYDKLDEAVAESGIRDQLEELASHLDAMHNDRDTPVPMDALTERLRQIEDELSRLRVAVNQSSPASTPAEAGPRVPTETSPLAPTEAAEGDEATDEHVVVPPKDP